MLVNLVGWIYILSGVVTVAIDPRWSPNLLLDAVFILAGFGLLRRYAVARTVTMGMLLSGSFSCVILPPLIYWAVHDTWRESLEVLIFFGWLPLPVFARIVQNLPVIIAVSVLVLLIFSGIAYFFYRYFQREEVAAEFGHSGWPAGGLVFGQHDVKVYLIAVIFSLLVAAPVFETKRQQAVQKAVEDESYALRMIEQVQFSADGGSIVTASYGDVPELRIARVDRKAVAKKSTGLYRMNSAQPWNGRVRDRLWMRLSTDNRFFFTESPDGAGFADLQTDEVHRLNALRGRTLLPLGFLSDSTAYLYYVPVSLGSNNQPEGGRLELADIAGDHVRYSVEASRPQWLSGEGGVNALSAAVRQGLFSPDRRHYAYVYRERLHILDTQKGEVAIVDELLDSHDQLFFSSEGDAVLGNRYSGSELTGFLYVMGSEQVQKHALHGSIQYLSTTGDLLVRAHDAELSAYRLSDLTAAAVWRIEADSSRVSPDGKFLFMRTAQGPWQFAELTDDVPQLKPLKTRLNASEAQPVGLFVGGEWIAVVQGAMMEVMRINSLQKPVVASQLLDWRTKP